MVGSENMGAWQIDHLRGGFERLVCAGWELLLIVLKSWGVVLEGFHQWVGISKFLGTFRFHK